jgi:hypothetical protein
LQEICSKITREDYKYNERLGGIQEDKLPGPPKLVELTVMVLLSGKRICLIDLLQNPFFGEASPQSPLPLQIVHGNVDGMHDPP